MFTVARHVLRRPFSTAASAPVGPSSRVYEFAAFVASVTTVGTALAAFHYLFVENSINKKIAELNAIVAILKSEQVVLKARNVLDAKMSGMVSSVTKEVDAKISGMVSSVTKEVDAKMSGIAGSVTKEVDAKMSGIAGSVTKEVEGLSKTLEAKIATTINSAGLKAEAETLRVLSEYKVHAPPLHLHAFVALL
jgi:exosortase/archaeosortase